MVGTMSLDSVNYVEFHADTWDYGYTLWLDGVQFYPCSPVTAVPPEKNGAAGSLQVWPNPFTETARISFRLEYGENITLEMYDSRGTKIITLANGYRQPGNYSIPVSKGFLSSGIYLIRLTTSSEFTTRKLVLIR